VITYNLFSTEVINNRSRLEWSLSRSLTFKSFLVFSVVFFLERSELELKENYENYGSDLL